MKWLKAAIPNLLVLGSLAGIAIWGHETDWTFIQFAHGESHAHSATTHLLDSDHAESLEHPPLDAASSADLAMTGIKLGFPEARSMQEHIVARGSIVYVQTRVAQISARVPGTVWRVDCKVGDPVREGDVLAILDAAEVGKAKAEFLQSLVQAEVKDHTLARLVAAGDSVPEKLRFEATAAVREARVQRYNAQQKLSNLGLPVRQSDLNELSDEARAERLHFLGLPPEIVKGLDHETTTANLIPVRAPFDGIVVRSEIVVGEVVSPDHSQLVIADVSQMALKLNISKEDAGSIQLGQKVSFTGDGLPGTLETQIDWISTEVDEKTRTIQVLAKVANPVLSHVPGSSQRLLKANMFGVGKICVRDQPDALVVPRDAVQWTGAEHIVFVAVPKLVPDAKSDSKPNWMFERRSVRTGSHAGGFVEVLSGLEREDRIVVNGGNMLKSELQQRMATASLGQVP